jgi:hypothetical protein
MRTALKRNSLDGPEIDSLSCVVVQYSLLQYTLEGNVGTTNDLIIYGFETIVRATRTRGQEWEVFLSPIPLGFVVVRKDGLENNVLYTTGPVEHYHSKQTELPIGFASGISEGTIGRQRHVDVLGRRTKPGPDLCRS